MSVDTGNAALKLCMISGSFEYDSAASLAAFAGYLDRAGHGTVQAAQIAYQSEDDDLSLAAIDDADVVLLFTRRLRTEGPELERFQAYCARGGPIVGVRTASHGFQNWLAFDREVLGGNYGNHYGAGPLCRVELAPNAAAADHPILRGVDLPFDSPGSLYRNTPLAADTTPLLTGRTDEASEPVAWTRVHRGGRVFTTSLGHQEDFRNPAFLRLLANAVFWAANR
jgi:type 1 glutamine amidotransferase